MMDLYETIKCNYDNIAFLISREPQLLEEISKLYGNISDRQPFICTFELQSLSKKLGEALSLHSRYYPFISELSDIDDYIFKRSLSVNRENRSLLAIVRYNIDNVIDDIKTGERPLPFPMEDYGEETFYKNETIENKNDIFDW